MYLHEDDPAPLRPMAASQATGLIPCPKCGQQCGARPGTTGWVIAECPRCGSTLVAHTAGPATGGVTSR